LDELRSKVITVIDQDPVIFHATFRENLDPSEQYSEEDIKKIVNRCGLKDIVDSKGGINSQIRSDSLSIGEKQLICICRALLKKTEIILIDEATANIDIKNDNLIQKIIK
jgi:ABC-type multidrug transport system fused ATPase/permease subunit